MTQKYSKLISVRVLLLVLIIKSKMHKPQDRGAMLKVLKEEYYVRRWSVSEGTRPKGEFNRERALIPHQNRATHLS